MTSYACTAIFLFILIVGLVADNSSASTSEEADGNIQRQFEQTQKFKNDLTNSKISEYKAAQLSKPSSCKVAVQETDHLLFEYHVEYSNGTILPLVHAPNQRHYFHLTSEHSNLPIYNHILGMCEESTKSIQADFDSNLIPFVASHTIPDLAEGEAYNLVLTLNKVTTDKDFQIFYAIKNSKWELAFELLENHTGVNAVDEWGQTPLLLAVANQYEFLVPPLLNSRLPKVNINYAKHNGITALYYAVEKPKMFSTFQAILKKGADPNIHDHNGNSPLHIACLMEKSKYAEKLLEYGANAYSTNSFGLTPIQLVPRDATHSIRSHFQKMFKEASEKDANRLSDANSKLPGSRASSNREL